MQGEGLRTGGRCFEGDFKSVTLCLSCQLNQKEETNDFELEKKQREFRDCGCQTVVGAQIRVHGPGSRRGGRRNEGREPRDEGLKNGMRVSGSTICAKISHLLLPCIMVFWLLS